MDQARPDELVFYFSNQLSAYNTDEGDKIVNVVTIGTDMTIQCTSTIGDEEGEEAEVKSYEGTGFGE